LRDVHTQIAGNISNGALSLDANATITIPTWLHIVTPNGMPNTITKKMVDDQFRVLNDRFRPSGIQFRQDGTKRVESTRWALGTTDVDDIAMKTALREGGYGTLNIYFQVEFSTQRPRALQALGECYTPRVIGPLTPYPRPAIIFDGCNIRSSTMPGGNFTDFNLGTVTVHEVGHWFGLLHVFEGANCEIDGDMIADTPRQLTPSDGPLLPGQTCPDGKDSCPLWPGPDSIHNYMDYVRNVCQSEFTKGQAAHARQAYKTLRQGK
jgi:hypothetical protein